MASLHGSKSASTSHAITCLHDRTMAAANAPIHGVRARASRYRNSSVLRSPVVDNPISSGGPISFIASSLAPPVLGRYRRLRFRLPVANEHRVTSRPRSGRMEGVFHFNRAFVTQAGCSQSRASILTDGPSRRNARPPECPARDASGIPRRRCSPPPEWRCCGPPPLRGPFVAGLPDCRRCCRR